jgi:hypothetical protein
LVPPTPPHTTKVTLFLFLVPESLSGLVTHASTYHKGYFISLFSPGIFQDWFHN